MKRRHHPVRAALLALLAASAGLYGLTDWLRSPALPPQAPPVTVEFPIGTPTRVIFDDLASGGVVHSAVLANLYYRVFYRREPLKAGEYSFTGGQTLDDVLLKIIAGEVVRHRVVIPEGLTNEETFHLFLEQRIGTREGFELAAKNTALLPWATPADLDLEGFLFPSTYIVTRSTSTRQVVRKMAEEFLLHFTPEMRQRVADEGMSIREAVILASFVEKETAIPSERPRIAAVYLNRLHRHMKLQCDPTVIYALMRAGRWTGKLHRSDLDFDSPYNTYVYAGLPPGPICNPGLASLEAAVHPARSQDLYFVATGDGGHYFSRTYDEHLAMIARRRATLENSRPD